MIRLWLMLTTIAITALLVSYPLKSAAAADGGRSRTEHYVCTLDLALRANDASASVVSGTTGAAVSGTTRSAEEPKEVKKSKSAKTDVHHANLIGRGLANCKNEHGFQFNLPAVIAISLTSDQALPVESLRASMAPMSVDRDVNMIFDRYTPHVELRNTPSVGTYSSSDRVVVVKGAKHDLLMQIDLNVPAEFTSKVNVARVELGLDKDAPKDNR